eukprot:COSAG01_NODE_2085_length_8459_cov_14.269139_9_plen_93_part_00
MSATGVVDWGCNLIVSVRKPVVVLAPTAAECVDLGLSAQHQSGVTWSDAARQVVCRDGWQFEAGLYFASSSRPVLQVHSNGDFCSQIENPCN